MELIDILTTNKDDIQLSIPYTVQDKPPDMGVFDEEQCKENFYGINKNKMCTRGGLLWICQKPTGIVLWRYGKIAIYPWNPYMNAVSFQFSGCLMAAFCCNQQYYIAHIQRGDADCMDIWINFIKANEVNISSLVMFRPDAEAWDRERSALSTKEKSVSLWGLITPERHCYSLCVRDRVSWEEGRQYSLVFLTRHYAGLAVKNYRELLDSSNERDRKSFFIGMQKWSVVPPRTAYLKGM